MKKLLIASIAILSLFGTANASTSQNDGFYAGINIGVASVQDMVDIDGNLNISNGQQSLGDLGVVGGYNFNKFFATELNYLYVGTYSITISSGPYSATMNQENSFLTLNAKGTLPLNEKFDLFGKIGAGANFAAVNYSNNVGAALNNGSSTNFVVVLGVGGVYNLNENVSFNLSDSYFINTAPTISSTTSSVNNFSFGNVNSINLGMQYNF